MRLFGIIDAPQHVPIWLRALPEMKRNNLRLPIIGDNVDVSRPQFALEGLTFYYCASMSPVTFAGRRWLVTMISSLLVPYDGVRFGRWEVIGLVMRTFESTGIVVRHRRRSYASPFSSDFLQWSPVIVCYLGGTFSRDRSRSIGNYSNDGRPSIVLCVLSRHDNEVSNDGRHLENLWLQNVLLHSIIHTTLFVLDNRCG